MTSIYNFQVPNILNFQTHHPTLFSILSFKFVWKTSNWKLKFIWKFITWKLEIKTFALPFNESQRSISPLFCATNSHTRCSFYFTLLFISFKPKIALLPDLSFIQ